MAGSGVTGARGSLLEPGTFYTLTRVVVTQVHACVKIQQAVQLRFMCFTGSKGVRVYSASIYRAPAVRH